MRERSLFSRRGRRASTSPPETIHGSYPVVHLYTDESGNGGNPSLPLIVGALTTDTDAPLIEQEVRRLHEELSSRRDLRGLQHFNKFREVGFHAKNDVQQIAEPFRRLINELPGLRVLMAFTDRSSLAPLNEIEQIEKLYEFLVSDALLRYAGYEQVVCHIERNDSLKRLQRELSSRATEEARRKAGPFAVLPELEVTSVDKSEVMSLAILDYVMMAVKRWADLDFERDITKWKFREFAGLENTVSLLYSLEQGPIVTRKSAIHGQQSN